jgi:cephalosporin hydroxylase
MSTRLFDEYESRLNIWSDIQDHMPVLFEMVTTYPHAHVVELGTRTGNSTSAFLAGVEKVGGFLTSIDVNEPNVPPWMKASMYWKYFVEDDMTFDVNQLPMYIDILFIDTSHDYDHTLAELKKFYPLVEWGGTILMHDTNLEVMPGLKPQEPFPVRRALDTFCGEINKKWDNLDGPYGLGVIRK